MDEKDYSRLKIINASGYLFQLRVEDEIRRSKSYALGNMEIVASEHRWVDRKTLDESFIDTIVQKGILRVVIETKRVQDAEWIFLVPHDLKLNHNLRLRWTHINKDDDKYHDWSKIVLTPHSLRSAFCLIRGQGEKNLSMLERIGGYLLRSVEALSIEELNYSYPSERSRSFTYLPIIITNAKLLVCRIDSEEVDITTGTLDIADFVEVPYIQFYKNMSSSLFQTDKTLNEIKRSNEYNNRSVMVVNSANVIDFFDDLSLPNTLEQPWMFI